MEKLEVYCEKRESLIRLLDAEIDKLKVRLNDGSSEMRDKHQAVLDGLYTKRETSARRFLELRSAGTEDWKEAKEAKACAERAWRDLKESVGAAVSAFA